MARFIDREKALALRKSGMSYSQIKKILGLSKSTLSGWLRNYPLSKQRIRELRDCNEQRIERCRETKRKKRELRLMGIYKNEKRNLLPLNNRELFIAGLMLYWGEGTKCRTDGLSISNTDPAVMNFFIYWMKKTLSVPEEKMKVQVHLYTDMNIKNELNYWSKIIKIPLSQFTKPYIKKSSMERINHKGGFGHGTCNIRVNNVKIGEKIIMGLKVVADHFSK